MPPDMRVQREELAARIRSALKGRNDVVERHTFAGAAFMVRGHMSFDVVGSSLMCESTRRLKRSLWKSPGSTRWTSRVARRAGPSFVDPPGIASAAALTKDTRRLV